MDASSVGKKVQSAGSWRYREGTEVFKNATSDHWVDTKHNLYIREQAPLLGGGAFFAAVNSSVSAAACFFKAST